METTTSSFKLVKRIKDDKFNVDHLHYYYLLLQIGTQNFQMCVADPRKNHCLLIENYQFEKVGNVEELIQVLSKIFENHHLLMAGFWAGVKMAVKNDIFTLVPSSVFVKDSLNQYLALNAVVDEENIQSLYYKHAKSEAINVFGVERKLIDWVFSIYKKIKVQVVHHGSAFIEGILRNDDHTHDKSMFILVEGSHLQVVVTRDKKLLYYNQFTSQKVNDFMKYILLIMRALRLDQNTSKVLVWGDINNESAFFKLLYKYTRNISFGNKPSYLSFNYMFDELHDHQYFDLYSLYLCD